MKHKKIIIIGAASGIGKEMAKIYAQYNLVAISGRRNDLLLQLQNQYPEAIIPFC
ncbi:MAG: hypothetical protein ICV66_08295, partial [Chitinophagaceae bacterium]|nr:hypothetical protein [Chitinophagaceae bacterium]